MRWLITGGVGFIGSNLIERLLNEGGHAIRVIDTLQTCGLDAMEGLGAVRTLDPSDLSPIDETGVELVQGNVLDADLVVQAAKGAEVVVHLAANTGVAPSVADPRADCETNVFGVLNALEAARANNISRFVFASSGAPAGEITPPIHEEVVPHPVSPYGASKLAGEGYCSAYYRTFGIETVALRFGNVYGPRSRHKSSVVAAFINNASQNLPLVIYGNGEQTRDFIYISDLVEAILSAASKPGIGGEIYQIAAGREITIGELAEVFLAEYKSLGNEGVEIRYDAPRQGDVMRNYSDTSKAAEQLGWHVKVQLPEGLKKTLSWFQSQQNPAVPSNPSSTQNS